MERQTDVEYKYIANELNNTGNRELKADVQTFNVHDTLYRRIYNTSFYFKDE